MTTLSFADIKSMIDPQVGKLETLEIVNSETARGASTPKVTSGLFVARSGAVSGSVSGTKLKITLEGGEAGWEGAITNTNVIPYYTRAQLDVATSIVRYVASMNNSVEITSDTINVF